MVFANGLYSVSYRIQFVRKDGHLKILKTKEYDHWFYKLRDLNAKFHIGRYFQRVQGGDPLFGDYKSVGGKVIEVRFNYGPGYRVYLTQTGRTVVLLLLGGDKSTQKSDIQKAQKMATEWRSEHGDE